jgi:hypothetical protein
VYDAGIIDKIYVTWWERFEPPVGTGGQWKIFRLSDGEKNTVKDTCPEMYFNTWYKPDHSHSYSQIFNRISCSGTVGTVSYPTGTVGEGSSENLPEPNAWTRFEIYFDENSGASIPDGTFQYWIHKQDAPVKNVRNWVRNMITRDGNCSRSYCKFQDYFGNHNGLDEQNVHFYTDDIYVQTGSLARVELCDASTWSLRKHCEIQVPQSTWNSSQIKFSVNAGSFTSGKRTYLYVVDATGAVNSNGYPVTLGGSQAGDITAPASPRGLLVL